MSLDLYYHCKCCGRAVFEANATHNLGPMARAAGIYSVLWRPSENGIDTAGQLVEPLTRGLADLAMNEDGMRKLEPSNGWGSYEGFVQFVRSAIDAAKEHPAATVHASI